MFGVRARVLLLQWAQDHRHLAALHLRMLVDNGDVKELYPRLPA